MFGNKMEPASLQRHVQTAHGRQTRKTLGGVPALETKDCKSAPVVTGGTDGIGKQYARQLAKRGLNIILISRDMEKLRATAQELEFDFRVRTQIIQADLSEGRHIYPEIAKQLEGKEIGILINNAGVMYDSPSLFLNVPEKKLIESVNINMMAVMMMTYIVLPQMVERKKGLIVNMSSISSFYPLPLMAVYSASKVCNVVVSISDQMCLL
ncbi:hypothetical protein V5799_014873 [Amblyomma americanum]|uniref:Uncharacterized protein n=1 Tax=Amblyomma americanum TaxID=6943 RepID=A0AAQ4E1S3_AMBAM